MLDIFNYSQHKVHLLYIVKSEFQDEILKLPKIIVHNVNTLLQFYVAIEALLWTNVYIGLNIKSMIGQKHSINLQ